MLFVFLLIGCLGFNLFYSQPLLQEAFNATMTWKTGRGLPEMGSPLNWSMEKGLPNSWNHAKGLPSPPLDRRSIQGTQVPLPHDQMFFFKDNKSSQACCGTSSYSTADGCVCVSQKQIDYINQRGGNRTREDGF